MDLRIPISKLDEDQRLITGWALISTNENGQEITDYQGDVVPVIELEKAAHELMLSGGKGKTDNMHDVFGVGSIVESMVITKQKREALGMGNGPEGWLVTMKIEDPKLWEEIKAGKKPELSIFGESECED